MLQRLALQKFHGQKQFAVGFLNVVNRADVRVVQRRRRPRFSPQPLQRLAVFGIFLRQKLQGHEAAQLGVLGLVDHTHAAATELFHDAIMRDGFADHSSVKSIESLSVTSFRSDRHAALQFFKPVQHDVDLRQCHQLLLAGLEH